jgi:dTDP-4-amino-4,6-dideoxygalactose transaminase
LVLFGGRPAFEDALHVGRPNIGDRQRFLERVGDILDRKWLTNAGAYVSEFERRIAEYAGVEHCVATCNATIALEIVIRALGMSGEVIVPSFTHVVNAHVLQWQGITPVFCDIDPRTHTIDPNQVEQLISLRTTGIIGVHLWGRPCDIEALSDIARRRGLKLLFDSAQALGCTYGGRMIGAFGNAEVFSFHATKFLNSLEGGAVVTNDGELARKVRLMKNFGFTNYDTVDCIGTNGKMNEVSAAMGLTNLESLTDFISINRRNHKQYQEELAGLEGVTLLAYDQELSCNYQYVVLEMDESKTILTRDQVIQILRSENILARRYFYPGCHRVEPYRTLYPNTHLMLPQTDRVAERVITLPTGQVITPEIICVVCDIIRTAFKNAAEIGELLRTTSLMDFTSKLWKETLPH